LKKQLAYITLQVSFSTFKRCARGNERLVAWEIEKRRVNYRRMAMASTFKLEMMLHAKRTTEVLNYHEFIAERGSELPFLAIMLA
jgi:excinuclease UvrABC helicase subunit UvrB